VIDKAMVMKRFVMRAGAFVLLVASYGCGKQARLVPVEGIVRIGGEPAANIAVQFLPDAVAGEPRPSSFATTDDEGIFRLLVAGDRQGAVVGQHSIILADCDEERPAQGERLQRPPRLHGRYSTMAGGLRATVEEDGGRLEIDVPAIQK